MCSRSDVLLTMDRTWFIKLIYSNLYTFRFRLLFCIGCFAFIGIVKNMDRSFQKIRKRCLYMCIWSEKLCFRDTNDLKITVFMSLHSKLEEFPQIIWPIPKWRIQLNFHNLFSSSHCHCRTISDFVMVLYLFNTGI